MYYLTKTDFYKQFYRAPRHLRNLQGRRKIIIPAPHRASVSCHPSPHQNPSLSVQLSCHPPPSSSFVPRLAQSTNRAASDRQWRSFSSTHSHCGWEAEQSMPAGSLLSLHSVSHQTHQPHHWKSYKTSDVVVDTDDTKSAYF